MAKRGIKIRNEMGWRDHPIEAEFGREGGYWGLICLLQLATGVCLSCRGQWSAAALSTSRADKVAVGSMGLGRGVD